MLYYDINVRHAIVAICCVVCGMVYSDFCNFTNCFLSSSVDFLNFCKTCFTSASIFSLLNTSSPLFIRFDLRQFLYNTKWTRQFRSIDELVKTNSLESAKVNSKVESAAYHGIYFTY